LPGVNQVNVNEKAGLTFASALKAFLRQDPDVIMVGEIRDLETADIAIKAAQTGHMVLSTLHTNDAPATLTRMSNMGIAPYNIAASVSLITAQRLVRRLCMLCRAPAKLSASALRQAGLPSTDTTEYRVFTPQGCPACHKGFKGRTGIFEVMPVSTALQDLIVQEADSLRLERQARQDGMHSLREAGLRKVIAGETSLDEVLAATREQA